MHEEKTARVKSKKSLLWERLKGTHAISWTAPNRAWSRRLYSKLKKATVLWHCTDIGSKDLRASSSWLVGCYWVQRTITNVPMNLHFAVNWACSTQDHLKRIWWNWDCLVTHGFDGRSRCLFISDSMPQNLSWNIRQYTRADCALSHAAEFHVTSQWLPFKYTRHERLSFTYALAWITLAVCLDESNRIRLSQPQCSGQNHTFPSQLYTQRLVFSRF